MGMLHGQPAGCRRDRPGGRHEEARVPLQGAGEAGLRGRADLRRRLRPLPPGHRGPGEPGVQRPPHARPALQPHQEPRHLRGGGRAPQDRRARQRGPRPCRYNSSFARRDHLDAQALGMWVAGAICCGKRRLCEHRCDSGDGAVRADNCRLGLLRHAQPRDDGGSVAEGGPGEPSPVVPRPPRRPRPQPPAGQGAWEACAARCVGPIRRRSGRSVARGR
mmetsp:Transcript_53402/g.107289  ORF Transcript_53402/g.107289 Transcript_53402/m.107289 type:complete len:219 (+) Transcript_53402:449-1105(+)